MRGYLNNFKVPGRVVNEVELRGGIFNGSLKLGVGGFLKDSPREEVIDKGAKEWLILVYQF